MTTQPKIACYCLKTRRAAAAITRHYDQALAPCGITSAQFSLLLHLSHSPGCTASKLAALSGLDRSTLTRNLRPLVGKELVWDASPPEARDSQLELTEAGKQALECAQVRWEQAQEDVRQRLGEVGLAALDAALTALEKL